MSNIFLGVRIGFIYILYHKILNTVASYVIATLGMAIMITFYYNGAEQWTCTPLIIQSKHWNL